ncbi:hypothetical protein PGT21_010352 [Puccinia graminis f. sp. tritici]|uniref:Uncharacterized protein n=1 Tax=Puccinia graminis f. sp. tritici TaxID=56615 RepID=A0A5B0QEX9_PUCGR|nr:hypothetical protein PGT21_010352 [Puccinia graminis f. sp. tritici]
MTCLEICEDTYSMFVWNLLNSCSEIDCSRSPVRPFLIRLIFFSDFLSFLTYFLSEHHSIIIKDMDPVSRSSNPLYHPAQQARPPLPSGSPSRFALHPFYNRLSIGHNRPPLASADPHLPPFNALHPRPRTPFPARPDQPDYKSTSLHSRSFSYDDQSLSKDRPIGSAAYLDLDDIIGRSASSRCLLGSSPSAVADPDQLNNQHHQRSLSVPAAPADRGSPRVRFETTPDTSISPPAAVHSPHREARAGVPSSPLAVAVSEAGADEGDPQQRQSDGSSQGRVVKVEEDRLDKSQDEFEDAVKLMRKLEIDRLARRRAELQDTILPIMSPGSTMKSASSPPTNTGSAASTELPIAELGLISQPEEIDLYHPLPDDTEHPVRPSSPHQRQQATPPPVPPPGAVSSPTLGSSQPTTKHQHCLNSPSARHHHQHQHPHLPLPSDPSTSTTPTTHFSLPSCPSPTGLAPQAYPGKPNPLLPPPSPAPKPTLEIRFPRPFRRRLSLEPTAVQLPPSPPPEFDFSAFDNPLPQSNSSLLLYSLLDDSPCMSNHSLNEDLSGRPLIDLTDQQEEPTGHANSQHSPQERKLPSRTPHSHFTPLSSPVISERPYLSSIFSSPLTQYLPTRDWNRADDPNHARENKNGSELSENIRSLSESIPICEPTPSIQKTTQTGEHSPSRRPTPPQPPSDHTASAPVDRPTAHSSATHTPRKQSTCRGHSSPARVNQEEPIAPARTVASSKRSHSRAPSVHWSVHQSPAVPPGPEPLTEEALRLHQTSDRILSRDSVHRSQAGAGRPDVAPWPRPADCESRVTRWDAGEPKDDELASLVESINQRNEERSQMLTGLLRAVSRGIQAHDREAEAETAMVRDLSRARQSQLGRGTQSQLGELAGEECGGSQFSAPFGSPSRTLPPPASIREGHFSPTIEQLTHLHPRGPSLGEASVAASLRAHSLMDSIRVRRSEAPSHGMGGQMGPASVAGSGKARSTRTVVSRHESLAAPKPSAPATIRTQSLAPSNRASQAPPSNRAQSVTPSARNPSRAPSQHEPSAGANSQNPAPTGSVKAPSKAGSVTGTPKTKSVAGSARAPSISGAAKAASIAGTVKAPSVAGSNRRSAAGTAKAPSLAGSKRAGTTGGSIRARSAAAEVSPGSGSVAGTVKAPSIMGSQTGGSISGAAKAASLAGSKRAGTTAGSVRAPSEVVVEKTMSPGSAISERPESIDPPSVAEDGVGGEGEPGGEGAGGEGEQGGEDAAGGEEEAGGEGEAEGEGEQGGHEEAAEGQPAPADPPAEDLPAADDPSPPAPIAKSGPASVLGSLAGEIIGGEPGEGSKIVVEEEEDPSLSALLLLSFLLSVHEIS